MKRMLMLHSSHDGQTIKIMNYIKTQLNDLYDCEIQNIHDLKTLDINGVDFVLIGAAVRYGHLNKKLYEFINSNKNVLNSIDNAFFCVNLTARKPGKDVPEGSAYIKTFLKRSPWQPKKLAVFAGALRYPHYGFFDRIMIQLIMKITGGETDATKEVEYTDWEKVRGFCDEIEQN